MATCSRAFLCALTILAVGGPVGQRGTLADESAASAADLDALGIQVVSADQPVLDAFMGDWQGQWQEGWPRQLVAQVIPRGGAKYQVHFKPVFDQRCPPLAIVEARVADGDLKFDQDGWSGIFTGDRLIGSGSSRSKPTAFFEMKKVTRLSPRLGAPPPEGATVLLDGSGFDHWESDGRDGVQEIPWKQIDDFVRVWPPLAEHSFAAAIRTRRALPNFRLHLEFRLPLIAEAAGQTRANSGIIIEEFEFYELQILDSYGLPGYYDECGSIYNKAAPKVNMCAPPGQWQSYDIVYHGPRVDDSGKLTAKAHITVDHNGKRIHNQQELPYSDAALKRRRERPGSKMPGRITLQHHGDPIDFRNTWIEELK